MSGILFLSKSDFKLKQGDKGMILALNCQMNGGMTLVLFYTNECPHCEHIIKIFKQLPHRINGCSFAPINLTLQKEIVEISQQTIAPITYVPDLILYVNNSPFVRYDGNPNIESIVHFLSEMNQKIQHINFMSSNNNTSQTSPSHNLANQTTPPSSAPVNLNNTNSTANTMTTTSSPSEKIPAYTIGMPLYGHLKKDNVCYVNFHQAYISV